MVEVYLDGVLGREYRKLMSAIPAGFGAGRHREDAERPAERVSGRGEGGESALSRPLFVEEGGTCSASLFRACSGLFQRPAGRSLSTAPPFRAGVGKSSAKAAATGQLALPGTVLAGVRQGDTASDPLELRMFQHVQRLTAQMEFQVFLQLALLHGFPFFTASWPHCGAGESTEATRRIVVP
jgi:hypothetical protein